MIVFYLRYPPNNHFFDLFSFFVNFRPPPPQRQNIRKNATNIDFVTSQSSTDAIQAKLGPNPKRAVRAKEPKPLAHCTFLNSE